MLIDTESYDHGFKGAFKKCYNHIKTNSKARRALVYPFSFITMAINQSWDLDLSGAHFVIF